MLQKCSILSTAVMYYRCMYADPGYSITEMPLSLDDCKLLKKAIALLGNKENIGGDEIMKVLAKVRNRLTTILNYA